MRAADRLHLSFTRYESFRCLGVWFSFFKVTFSALIFNIRVFTTSGNIVTTSSGNMAKKSSSILSSSEIWEGGRVGSESVEAMDVSTSGSRTTNCWTPRATLNCGTREQQNVSSVKQFVHTEFGQSPTLLQGSAGFSLME